MNHRKHTWLNDFQFKTFDVWKHNHISKELIDKYKEVLSVNRKRKIIDDVMKKLPDDVVMYQLKKNHIFRLNNRRIVKKFVMHVTLVPDTSQMLQRNKIMLIKTKV